MRSRQAWKPGFLLRSWRLREGGGLRGHRVSWGCPGSSWLSQALDAGVPRPAGWRSGGFCRKGLQRFGAWALPLSSLPWVGVRWGPRSSLPHPCQQLPFSVPLLSPAWPAGPSQQHKPQDLLLLGVGVAEKGENPEVKPDLPPRVPSTDSGHFPLDGSLLGPILPSASPFSPSPLQPFSPG